jgi:hypothetical protein
VDLIPKIAHFVILTPTGNYRFLKFKSVKNNPFWAIYACVVEARPCASRPAGHASPPAEDGISADGFDEGQPNKSSSDSIQPRWSTTENKVGLGYDEMSLTRNVSPVTRRRSYDIIHW